VTAAERRAGRSSPPEELIESIPKENRRDESIAAVKLV
jgi:hypothetical protein